MLCESYTVQNEPGYGCALCDFTSLRSDGAVAACLVYCVSGILCRMSLAMDVRCATLHRYVELVLWQHVLCIV